MSRGVGECAAIASTIDRPQRLGQVVAHVADEQQVGAPAISSAVRSPPLGRDQRVVAAVDDERRHRARDAAPRRGRRSRRSPPAGAARPPGRTRGRSRGAALPGASGRGRRTSSTRHTHRADRRRCTPRARSGGGVSRAAHRLGSRPGRLRLAGRAHHRDRRLRSRCGCSIAIVWTIIPPIDAPTTCARSMPRWSSRPIASAAMSDSVYGTGGDRLPASPRPSPPCRSTSAPSSFVDSPQSRLSKRMTKRPVPASSSQKSSVPQRHLGGEAHHEQQRRDRRGTERLVLEFDPGREAARGIRRVLHAGRCVRPVCATRQLSRRGACASARRTLRG